MILLFLMLPNGGSRILRCLGDQPPFLLQVVQMQIQITLKMTSTKPKAATIALRMYPFCYHIVSRIRKNIIEE